MDTFIAAPFWMIEAHSLEDVTFAAPVHEVWCNPHATVWAMLERGEHFYQVVCLFAHGPGPV